MVFSSLKLAAKPSSTGGFSTEPGKELNIIPGTSSHIQLQGKLRKNLNVKLFDLDLIDNSPELISELKTKDKIVICYFSVGTAENFREDFDQIPQEILGKTLPDFPDEFWLDIRDSRTLELIKNRLDLAVIKGCDGVDPDNLDAFANDSGFPLTMEDQISFNSAIATEAHSRGLSVGLKNALSIIPDLVDNFNFAINEQCEVFNECEFLKPFIEQDKAVFQIEYKKKFKKGKRKKSLCKEADLANRDLVFYKRNLAGSRVNCPNKFRNLPND